jgi:pilus assembly protein CpaB
MARSKNILMMAILLGVIAAFAGYLGLRALARQVVKNTSKEFVPVVVTATDLTFGTKLDRTQLRVARYPKESVPQGAFFLTAREPVTETKLSSRGGGLSMLVHRGLRATSLEVNQVSGVSGFVLPGDRVDVLCTVDERGGVGNATTRTILQNAEVLASGQKTKQEDNKPITVQAVTILVDPSGAEKIALGLHEGKLHLVLRNPEDNDTLRVAGLDTREMLTGNDGTSHKSTKPARRVSRTVRRSPEPTRVSVARAPKPTVRIIREAKVTELPAPKDSIR